MQGTTRILLVAVAAGTLGVIASVLLGGAGPLFRTEIGQRALQGVLTASAPTPPAGVAVAQRGERVPTFGLQRLDGVRVAIPDDFAGRPVLVNVWASWCGPCIKEMPELDRFARAAGPAGVQVLGIALDDAVAVRAFLERVPVGYPIVLDQPGPADAGVRLGNRKGVLPYSVLLDAQGRLVKQRVGPFADGEIDGWAKP